MTAPTFKVGDKVRRINFNNTNAANPQYAFIGDTGVVARLDESYVKVDLDKNGRSDTWDPANTELVVEPSVSAQVAQLEVELAEAIAARDLAAKMAATEAAKRARAEHDLGLLRTHTAPFSREQAYEIARQVEGVLSGRTAIPSGMRSYRFAVADNKSWGYAVQTSESSPSAYAPSYRTVQVSW